MPGTIDPRLSLRTLALVGAIAAPLSAAAASAYLAVAPTYAQASTSMTQTPAGTETIESPVAELTLADVNGSGVYVILTSPVLLAVLPLLFWRTTVRVAAAATAAALLTTLVILGGFSIGGVYTPAAAFALLTLASGRAGTHT